MPQDVLAIRYRHQASSQDRPMRWVPPFRSAACRRRVIGRCVNAAGINRAMTFQARVGDRGDWYNAGGSITMAAKNDNQNYT